MVASSGSDGALAASSSSGAAGDGESTRSGSSSSSAEAQPSCNGDQDGGVGYEFTGGETQLMRICMDAMHTAGLALFVQGIATALLGERPHQLIFLMVYNRC
jgi:hypothetical protein